MNYYAVVRSPDSDYLEHYGILGMKWGIRRFQNPDGSLTEEGRKRYGDILTPDQMKGMIKSYNLRTGKNKKINKKTTFKTSHGTYDYKGRRIDTDTEINDPGAQTKKETKTKGGSKSLSSMSDEELAARVARMKLEIEYKEKYASLNPKKMTLGQQFASNMREELVTQIPKGVAAAIKNGLAGALTSNKGDNNSNNQQNQQNQQKPKEQQQSKPKEQTKPKEQQPKTSLNEKVANAAQNIGELKDATQNYGKDLKADVKAAYEKGANATYNNRMSMAEKALNEMGFSENRSSGAYNYAKGMFERVARNASGSQYNSIDFYRKEAKNVTNGYYAALGDSLARDYSSTPVSSISSSSSNTRPLFSSSGSGKSNALFSTNVRDQKVAEIARQNVYNDSFYDELFDRQRD